ncbi:hypothetical protein INR49_009970 [Caranx melampygus]|nr:hypothetical protein INR49_009970 [Caranx melampygus]
MQKSNSFLSFPLRPLRGSMSLFKARDWWSAALGEGEEFDQGCLCVGDVDNSGSGHDKVVVGSYMGMLRIFSPHANKSSEGGVADAQLLRCSFKTPSSRWKWASLSRKSTRQ